MWDCWSFVCWAPEPLAHHQNVTSLSLFSRYYLGRSSSELFHLVNFLILEVGLLIILIGCMIFLLSFLDFIRIYVNNFVPCRARLCNSQPIECFPLNYDLYGFDPWFKSLKLRDTFYICSFFLNSFPVAFNLLVFLFPVTPCLIVAVQPCMEWIPFKEINFWPVNNQSS